MIGIIDYGVGNVVSLSNAVRSLNLEFLVSGEERSLSQCSHLIIAGVGSFPHAMTALEARGLDKIICNHVDSGQPLLGICIGMQVLFTKGLEEAETAGLGLISGIADRLPTDLGQRVPHMGWNDVSSVVLDRLRLFERDQDGASFYFAHSYHIDLREDLPTATTDFYDRPILALVEKENVFGVQFHPEKSQKEGLKILRRFSQL